ncbi:hypothetical protein K505DRAFT_421878 [Melanomma pulvis-pyrius CBS 109.77]|uniref:Uncharacterized protein n=1 Tax=Melanomma pulvis-pyrius CBS 109.77 TaxID=1314802 RepID=A0A6A6WTM3_9PLEO|nr:hypothetical protein K505DRAFT_421878 [Melanomma pulvis-pyrius CBS 109.77]
MDEVVDLASLENETTTELERKIIKIFRSLFDGDLIPEDVARKIDGLCSDTVLPNGEGDEKITTETFLWNLWTLVNQIVQECPTSNLDSIVEVLQHLRGISSRDVDQWGISRSLWKDLPFFAAYLRDDWQGPVEFEGESKDLAVKRWIRLNSFAARMLGRSWTDLGLLHFAIWELRDTLEEDVDEEDLLTRIAVAFEWIQHAGSVLFDSISSWTSAVETPREDVSMKPGSLYKGNSRVTLERWGFWKQRLREIGIKHDENVSTQALAAVSVMAAIEESIQQ